MVLFWEAVNFWDNGVGYRDESKNMNFEGALRFESDPTPCFQISYDEN